MNMFNFQLHTFFKTINFLNYGEKENEEKNN